MFANFAKFTNFFEKFRQNFEFGAVQKYANLVDLEKCRKMSIYLQKSASIQPRMDRLQMQILEGPSKRFWKLRTPQRGRRESFLSLPACLLAFPAK